MKDVLKEAGKIVLHASVKVGIGIVAAAVGLAKIIAKENKKK